MLTKANVTINNLWLHIQKTITTPLYSYRNCTEKSGTVTLQTGKHWRLPVMLSTRNGDECHVIIYISKILSKYIDTLRVKWQVTEYRTFLTSVLPFATHI